MPLIVRTPQNSPWEELRPPALLDSSIFNLPIDQLLDYPGYGGGASPKHRQLVVVHTHHEVSRATFQEGTDLAACANELVSQKARGFTKLQHEMATFHPYSEIGAEPSTLACSMGRSIGCMVIQGAVFTRERLADLQELLSGKAPLWRLVLSVGFSDLLQLTIYPDVFLIGAERIQKGTEREALDQWRASAMGYWK